MKDQLDEIIKESDDAFELKLLRELRKAATRMWHGSASDAAANGADVRRVLVAIDEAGFIAEDFGATKAETDAADSAAPTPDDAVTTDERDIIKELIRAAEKAWGDAGPGAVPLEPGSSAAVYNSRQAECGALMEKLGGKLRWQEEPFRAEGKSLSDLITAIDMDAVGGLTPLLHRIAETLGDHHERLSTFEEHHVDPDDMAPSVLNRISISWKQWQALVDWADSRDDHVSCYPSTQTRAALAAARQLRDMPERKSAEDGNGKSGEPTPAADEIARLTDECKRGDETLANLASLNRQLTQIGYITPRPNEPREVLLRMPRKVHDELCELLTRIPV